MSSEQRAEEASSTSPIHDALESFAALGGLDRSFWICNFIFMLDGAAYFGVLDVLTNFLHKDLGFGDQGAGWSVSYMTGMVTLAAATLGTLADRLGVRRTATIMIAVAFFGRGLLALSPSLPGSKVIALVALTLIAISAGILQPALYAGVKQVTNEKTQALGFSLLYALMNGGIFLQHLASPYVRQHKGWGFQGAIWFCVIITVFYWLMHLVLFPKNAGEPAPSAEKSASALANIKAIASPRFLFFIFILLGVRTLFAHQWLTMPQYIIRSYPKAVGDHYEWIAGLNPFVIMIGTPLVAALTRKAKVITMMIAGSLVSALATFMLVPANSTYALLGYVVVFSIGEALWSSRFMEYVASLAPPDKVGAYMGIAGIPWFIAKLTTGMYSGAMLARFVPEHGVNRAGTMWLIYGIVAMTSPIGLILARKWLESGSLTGETNEEPPAAAALAQGALPPLRIPPVAWAAKRHEEAMQNALLDV